MKSEGNSGKIKSYQKDGQHFARPSFLVIINTMIAYLIPTLNERNAIIPLISKILKLSDSNFVFIVDENSQDGTALFCQTTFNDENRVKVLVNPGKSGLGSSLKYGMTEILKLEPEGIITMDADGSHDAEASSELIKNSDYDLVIGSRYVEGGQHCLPLMRLWLSRIGNAISRRVLRANLTDTTSGFRYYDGLKLSKLNFFSISSNDYNFQIEILYQLLNNGARVREIPIKFSPRQCGRSKFSSKQILLSSMLLLRIFFKNS